MKRASIIISILIVCAISIFGHTVPKEEILAYLNSKEVHEATGVEKAAQDEKLPRLLVIEVNEIWFKLPPKQRVELAKKWHDLWTHTVAKGIVSVIETGSNQSVVSFRPDGRIELTK